MGTLLSVAFLLSGVVCSAVSLGLMAFLWLRAARAGAGRDADRQRFDGERRELVDRAAAAEVDRDRAATALVQEREAAARLREAVKVAEQRAGEQADVQEAFLARMSHELRTPLNAVTGYTELLLEDADPGVRPDLEKIRIAASNLGALVTSVLDLTELQSGDFAVRPEPVGLEALVAAAVDASRFVADQQGDRIEVDVEPGLAAVLDRRMITSILFHLVSNACKFTAKGTVRVRVRSAQPNLGGLPTDGFELTVSDTGIGMTERQVEAAFRAFAQGDDSFTRRYDGGGVGLAVVNGFVRAMGGEIAVRTAPGAGATVTVLLPRGCAAAPRGRSARTRTRCCCAEGRQPSARSRSPRNADRARAA